MIVARGRSLSVTKYKFALSVRLHHASLIAEFLIVLLTHSVERKGKKTHQFRSCQSFSVDIINPPFVLLDCILNATH